MSKTSIILFSLYLSFTNLNAQDVFLSGPGFLPYEAYYIQSIDLATGKADVQLFDYLVSSTEGNYPIKFHLRFTIEIYSPELGIDEKTTLLDIKTPDGSKISMQNPFRLDNRDLNNSNATILDISGSPLLTENNTPLIFVLGSTPILDIEKYENMATSIITMGRLPDGIYFFTLKIYNDTEMLDIKENIINISSARTLNLIYPGGALADTAQNLVYTPYPVFQWLTDPCPACKLFIRVAEFDPEKHSSPEEAIEDVTSLPINQTYGWEALENTTSFQYPSYGARELQMGKLYAWQIKKDIPTTIGDETYISPIFIFKLADFTIGSQSKQILTDPILIALKDLLGEETFNAYFGMDGELASFSPKDNHQVNEKKAKTKDILKIIDQIKKGTISIVSVNIE